MTSSYLPWWLPLSVLAWGVLMAVYHGVGLAFELCDRRHWLQRYKVRAADRLSYAQMLPRVLLNQTLILLPLMVAVEYLGLAFAGADRVRLWVYLVGLPLMTVGHDVIQYGFH